MSEADFIKLEFLLPNYEEQTAIAQVIQTADKEIELLHNKLAQLKEQKKGLMQVLLTGKKRLKVKKRKKVMKNKLSKSNKILFEKIKKIDKNNNEF